MSLDQFRPDVGIGAAAQHLAIQNAACGVFKSERPRRIHVPTASEALVQVRFTDADDRGDPLSFLQVERAVEDGSVACHIPHGSDSLQGPQDSDSGFSANRYVKMLPQPFSELLESYPMETAGERRRRKLRELCEKHGRDEVARRSDVNPFALEQVIKGVLLPPKRDGTRSPRNLGDSAARAIEKAFDLPEGWFDAPEEATGLDRDALEVAQAYQKMTPAEKMRLDRLMAAAMDVPLRQEVPRDIGGMSGLGDLHETEHLASKKKGA